MLDSINAQGVFTEVVMMVTSDYLAALKILRTKRLFSSDEKSCTLLLVLDTFANFCFLKDPHIF